jgi:hypothetical protein
MAKNGNKEDIVELWGREFTLAKNGLEEAQVVSFVNELIGERDLLSKRLEHMSSLTKLAEKTVFEADRLAEEIRKESADQAKAEASTLIAEAEEQARQMAEEKRAEIIASVTKEAEAIKTDAERGAELLLERERKKIYPEMKDTAARLYGELLSQLESFKKQVIASEAEFEHKLAQAMEESSTVTVENEPAFAHHPPANTLEESDTTPDTGSEVSLEGAEDISAESRQPAQTAGQTSMDKVEEEVPLSADGQDKSTYESAVELELLPPIDIKQIMGIMRYLDGLVEVENTELIPLADRPLITVYLREPINLIDVLMILPQVDEAREVTDEDIKTDGGETYTEGKRKRIQIRLFGNSVLDDSKGKLNSEVSQALSS